MSEYNVDELAARCAEETARYYRHQPNDPAFCYELWRLACALGVTEALVHVFRLYEPMAARWAVRIKGIAATGETTEFFATHAVRKTVFRLRTDFEKFATLGAILQFLKVCLIRDVRAQIPDDRRPPISISDEPPIADPGNDSAEIEADAVWARVCHLLPDEKDQLLARLTFIYDMKPRHVVQLHSELWSEEREVSVDLQRIRRILRRDRDLRNWSGSNDPNEPDSVIGN
jgi:hypothetical protein